MLSKRHSLKDYKLNKKGFTIVELLVVAPTVILAIGAFLVVIIAMVGEAVSTRSLNALTYQTQDALNRIDQDVKSSIGFLAQSSIAFDSENPQGYGDHGSTTPFTNVGSNGPMIILQTLATTESPNTPSNGYIYIWEDPLDCSSSNIGMFPVMTVNIVYFIKDGSLWRRTVTPANYTTAGCAVPWQQPSCMPGYSSSFCKTDDERLIDGVSPEDFSVQYFKSAGSSTELTDATNPNNDASTRQGALDTAKSVNIEITSNQQAGGRDIQYTGTLKSTRTSLSELSMDNETPGDEGDTVAHGDFIQTVTSTNCPTTRTMVVDARDNHTYWVQKLADGKCWMLTNLAYAGGGTNTYGDTKTLTDDSNGWEQTFTLPRYYVHTNANPTTNPTEPSDSTDGGETNPQYGYLYNWCGAMGGQPSACQNAVGAGFTSASVCPAGWRLPTGGTNGEFNELIAAIDETTEGLVAAALPTTWLSQFGGAWYSTFGEQGSSGRYWSSTQNSSDYAHVLNSYTIWSVDPVYYTYKTNGLSVRCVTTTP